MRISDWSSDVCSSDLSAEEGRGIGLDVRPAIPDHLQRHIDDDDKAQPRDPAVALDIFGEDVGGDAHQRNRQDETDNENARMVAGGARSEEHTSELQSLMRISYAVFCLKKKKNIRPKLHHT